MPIHLPKKYLPLIVGGVSGLIAVLLINNYIQQKTEEAKKRLISAQQNLSTVVVAKQDIPSGTTLKESMLKEETVYKDMLQPRAATSMDRLIDKITLAPIAKGEQVLLNKVTISKEEWSLSMKVPLGKRAITISVDNLSSVGGMLKAGDYVDITAMVPIPVQTPEGKQVTQITGTSLFQNVLVLAVGQETGSLVQQEGRYKKEEKREISPLITLALSPQEANLIAFVQEQGKIRLILRSPGDTQVQTVAPASWDTLFRTIMPQAFEEPPPPPQAPKSQRKVEIYRGLQREIKVIE